MRLLVATHNPGKRREYADLLTSVDAEWVTLDEAGVTVDVDETGTTFEENARLKAVEYARMSGLITLADDSGLVVDALDGAPGVYSARYAPGSDADRYTKLLAELDGMPGTKRSARFCCVVAVCVPDGPIISADGAVEGRIGYEPRGEFGFGYDPVFLVDGYDGKTLAELPPEIKNRISHRANALEALRPDLERLLSGLKSS